MKATVGVCVVLSVLGVKVVSGVEAKSHRQAHRDHTIDVHVGPSNTHGQNGPVTIEIGPLVWSYEKRAWVVANDSQATPVPTESTTKKPDKTNIIIAPDLECPEGEAADLSGVCREDWGRMMSPAVNSTHPSSGVVTNSSGHRCPQGQVADSQGQCRDNRGRIVPTIQDQPCPQGQVIDHQDQCRDNRGRIVPTIQDQPCPQGQVVDRRGQCKADRSRSLSGHRPT